MQIEHPLTVHIPDTRGVTISPFGLGNLKIGPGVYTYSRLPGHPTHPALGSQVSALTPYEQVGCCPGATPECEAICYAARPVAEAGAVANMWRLNSSTDEVPEIPADAKLLRIHIAGDFDTPTYILNWVKRLQARPDVTVWAYTRSWRCESLLEFLDALRALPNVQLFASMDASTTEMPPQGWRRAWILRTKYNKTWPVESRLHVYRTERFGGVVNGGESFKVGDLMTRVTVDGTPSYVCPEETGRKRNCVECGYCFKGQRHDVTFLEH